jgi:hypothetical protein
MWMFIAQENEPNLKDLINVEDVISLTKDKVKEVEGMNTYTYLIEFLIEGEENFITIWWKYQRESERNYAYEEVKKIISLNGRLGVIVE